MSTFSQRNGYVPIPPKMVPEAITSELRNTLWNLINDAISSEEYGNLTESLWIRLYKLPADSRPRLSNYNGVFWHESWKLVRENILNGEWHEVYDHVEFLGKYRPKLIPAFNSVLAHEAAAYRIIGHQVCQITDENEIESIQNALGDSDRFSPVADHIKAALLLMTDRVCPDYRNSIKESISAVESAAKIVTQNPNAELGKILRHLEAAGKINGALVKGFSAIYGWTSDQQGIRHAMLEEPNLKQSDAKFFLVICSAFANYLKAADINKIE